jgi:predicted RNA-binding protein associated with RNAse of E/G family
LSAKEGLLVRIDDKLKRIKNGSLEKDDEDVINDLIGYLVLLKIHTNAEKANEGPKGVQLVNGKIDINEFF